MAVALDSDAVIGFLDRDDVLHGVADAAVRRLLGEERLLVSAVTYAEVLTGARLGHHPEGQVAGFFAELISEVVPADAAVAEQAADFRGRLKSLQMPDALILALAQVHPEVDLLVTGDRSATKLGGLTFRLELLRPAGR